MPFNQSGNQFLVSFEAYLWTLPNAYRILIVGLFCGCLITLETMNYMDYRFSVNFEAFLWTLPKHIEF